MITYECDADTLAVSTEIGQWIYILDGAAVTKRYMPTQSVSGCAYTMVCEQWDETNFKWDDVTSTDPPFNYCNQANGIVVEVDATADASTYANYRPEVTHTYRVVYRSTYSRVTGGTDVAIDQFTVTFRDACYNLALGLTTGVSDFTYYVESTATKATKTPVFSDSSSGACSTSTTWYGKLTTADEDAWQLLSASSPIAFNALGIAVSSNDASLEATLTNHAQWTSGPVSYDIKAVFASDQALEYGGGVQATAQFVMTVVDACYYNELTCEPLDDIVYTIPAAGGSGGVSTQATVNCAFTAIGNDGNTLTNTECPLT